MVIVENIMNRDVEVIGSDDIVHDAAAKMSSRGISCLVIIEHGQPKGIITRRDILEKAVVNNLNPSNIKVKEMMSAPVITVSTGSSLMEVVEIMNKHGIKQVPCVDGQGLVQGIVTQTDIIRNVERIFER